MTRCRYGYLIIINTTDGAVYTLIIFKVENGLVIIVLKNIQINIIKNFLKHVTYNFSFVKKTTIISTGVLTTQLHTIVK